MEPFATRSPTGTLPMVTGVSCSEKPPFAAFPARFTSPPELPGRSPPIEGKQDSLSRHLRQPSLSLLGGKIVRLNRLHLTLSILVFSLLLASPAFANSVSMTYEGHGQGNNTSYPYLVSINGSSTFTGLICDSYDNSNYVGESWQATAAPLLQATGLFGSGMALDYKAAGLIFKSILAGTTGAGAGQWAIWGLLSANAASNPLYTSSGGAAVATQFLAAAGIAKNSAFNGLILYTPIAGTQTGNAGLPQEFIGYSAVPEPGSLMLMGTGLIGLAGVLRRKFAKA